jgi:hypothetical protein
MGPGKRLRYSDRFDDPNLVAEIQKRAGRLTRPLLIR